MRSTLDCLPTQRVIDHYASGLELVVKVCRGEGVVQGVCCRCPLKLQQTGYSSR